jgi:hypothetical protein
VKILSITIIHLPNQSDQVILETDEGEKFIQVSKGCAESFVEDHYPGANVEIIRGD